MLPQPPPDEPSDYRAVITTAGIAVGLIACVVGMIWIGPPALGPGLAILAAVGAYHTIAGRKLEREIRERGELES